MESYAEKIKEFNDFYIHVLAGYLAVLKIYDIKETHELLNTKMTKDEIRLGAVNNLANIKWIWSADKKFVAFSEKENHISFRKIMNDIYVSYFTSGKDINENLVKLLFKELENASPDIRDIDKENNHEKIIQARQTITVLNIMAVAEIIDKIKNDENYDQETKKKYIQMFVNISIEQCGKKTNYYIFPESLPIKNHIVFKSIIHVLKPCVIGVGIYCGIKLWKIWQHGKN